MALMFLSFIHSFSQLVLLRLLLGAMCKESCGIEVLRRHISVFQDLMEGIAGLHTRISEVTTRGRYLMVR